MSRSNYAELRSVVVGIGIISRGNHRNSRGPANEWLCVPGMGFLGFPEDGRSKFWRGSTAVRTREIVWSREVR